MALFSETRLLGDQTQLLARRAFTFAGQVYSPGDPFAVPQDRGLRRKARQLLEWGWATLPPEEQAAAGGPPRQPEQPADEPRPQGDDRPTPQPVPEDADLVPEPLDEAEEEEGEPYEPEPDLEAADAEAMARLKKWLEGQDKPEIAAWAERTHGLDLDRRMAKARMIEAVLAGIRAKAQDDAANG